MGEEELDCYLDSQRVEGTFASSGSIGIDLQRALEVRGAYTLPHPGLWAVRTMQGLVRLGATGIRVNQSRDCLSLVARLGDELPPEHSLVEVFRQNSSADPRYPLQAGLLAGLARGYAIEVHWSQDGQRVAMTLNDTSSTITQGSTPMALPAIEIHARPRDQGLLAKLFCKADFSHEFLEIAKRTFLAPIPVTLDERPCDFTTGFALHFYPALEFRGVRATAGPRLHLLPSVTRGLSRPGIASNDYYQPLGCGGYAFLLALGWSPKKARPSNACWVCDGALVQTEPLFAGTSPLHMSLFLPAQGLLTDATGMALLQSASRASRLREARLWATTSLKTHLPPTPADATDEALLAEVEARMKEALEACELTRPEARQVPDAIGAHLESPEQETPWQLQHLDAARSLARWGRFLSYTPPDIESLYCSSNLSAPTPERAKRFFGEVYVQMPAKTGRGEC
jgi:hypothetical protein